jgi:phosphatidylglycerophosphate synthase
LANTIKTVGDDSEARIKAKPPTEFLNYFGRDRALQQWLADKRTRLIATLVPRFVSLGLVPDTVSYIGIALLAGVILYFVREPVTATCFLAGHVICDGLDGAFARNSGKASQSGAFTDLVCDQLGLVVVALLAIFHNLVSPLLGAVYTSLYLIVVVFGVLLNALGLGIRITITSKYFLYLVYLIWAVWGINYIPELMAFFSILMTGEVIIGYFRLKRGIRRKFDAKVRFTKGDPYSGKLNYALNVAVPLVVFIAVILSANMIPLRAMIDTPNLQVLWKPGARIVRHVEFLEILGFGAWKNHWLILVKDKKGDLSVREIPGDGENPIQSFTVPGYVSPALSSLPVDGNVLLLIDRTTQMLMGIDLEASFAAGRSVMILTLPLEHLRVTAMAPALWKGKKVWLVANYLYTRKTYVIDPEKARQSGSILGGLKAWYINGGFPTGLVFVKDRVVEFNRSPFSALLYNASLDILTEGNNLLDSMRTSFSPPQKDAIGPIYVGEDLVMLSPKGTLFRVPVESVLR